MSADFREIGSFIKGLASHAIASITASGNTEGSEFDRLPTGGGDRYMSGLLWCAVGATTGTPTGVSNINQLRDALATGGTYADVTGEATTALVATAGNEHAVGAGATNLSTNFSALRPAIRCRLVAVLTGGTTPTVPVAVGITVGGAMTVPTDNA